VLDPFAGGGAIPLEAMRLGCDVTAADLNPVAWFILKCTLEYPQKLAGQTQPLPDSILRDREFMEDFLKEVKGLKGAKLRTTLDALGHRADAGEHQQDEWDFEQAAASAGVTLDADLAWHVHAWGRKVLAEARKELSSVYPTYAEWQPLIPGKAFEPQSMRFIEPDDSGLTNADKLNAQLSEAYLQEKTNPRWVAKPTVAYLWARAVTCKNCRTTIPLLKTLWLCKKDSKRIKLLLEANTDKSGIKFLIEHNVPERGGNAAQKRENDKKVGAGTMSRSGAQCPCCPAIMKPEDIRYEARNGKMCHLMTAVVIDGPNGKEYRTPTILERDLACGTENELGCVFTDVPFGIPNEPTPAGGGSGAGRAFSVQGYGLMQWKDLFTSRQLLALGVLVKVSRRSWALIDESSYPSEWREALISYSACIISRTVDYMANLCVWENGAEEVKHLFMRWALPITWDFAEANPIGPTERFFVGGINSASRVLSSLHACSWESTMPPSILKKSATSDSSKAYDLVFTDPPYYDAIPYSDLMDCFYVWLRRSLHGAGIEIDQAFSEALSPKWSSENNDGELIDDESRHSGDGKLSKQVYEDGMFRAFKAAHDQLAAHGRFVVVFAHKNPDAWETLASAVIRSGFVVQGSWPIATEMPGGLRNLGRASLASSIWLVCRKRDPLAKVGWDNRVMAEMRENIAAQLREFWDAGIRGPDFVWAATGPAMEAYSKYPAVIKANSPTKELLSVKEFLDAVRRIVIEFVVGRVLHIESGIDRLDSVTSYYLLHRNDFGFAKAPAGACILYAVSCGLSDAELERTWNLVKVKGSVMVEEEEGGEEVSEGDVGSSEQIGGGEFILRMWKERREKRMGFESVGGREIPLVDRVHRLMHLWQDGDVRKVDNYLDEYVLRQNELFKRLIQSLIELSEQASEERSLLESLSNHLGAKAPKADTTRSLGLDVEN